MGVSGAITYFKKMVEKIKRRYLILALSILPDLEEWPDDGNYYYHLEFAHKHSSYPVVSTVEIMDKQSYLMYIHWWWFYVVGICHLSLRSPSTLQALDIQVSKIMVIKFCVTSTYPIHWKMMTNTITYRSLNSSTLR